MLNAYQHPAQLRIDGLFVAIVHASLHLTGRAAGQVFLIQNTIHSSYGYYTAWHMLIEAEHQVHVASVHTECCNGTICINRIKSVTDLFSCRNSRSNYHFVASASIPNSSYHRLLSVSRSPATVCKDVFEEGNV